MPCKIAGKMPAPPNRAAKLYARMKYRPGRRKIRRASLRQDEPDARLKAGATNCATNCALIQSVLLAFIQQGLAADAQNFGALADFIARGFERGVNCLAFDFFQGTQR